MAKIKDLCIRVTSGGTPTSSKGEYYDNGTIPWLRTQEVDFKKIYKTDKHITELGLSKSSAKLIPENSVIVAMYGVTAGKVAINKIPLTTNQACCNLIIDRSKADYRYIYYSIFNMYGVLSRLGTGAAQQNLNAGQIGNIEIPLPTLDRQKQIAQVLESFDDLIENNSKRIEKLEAMARVLYRHHFEAPEADAWNKLPLYESIVVHRGKSYKSSELSNVEGLPFINLKCVNRGGGFRKDGLKLFTGAYKENQRVERGDLVMAVTDMTQERMIVARVARVPSVEGGFGVISMDVVKLEPKEGISKDYLYAMLRWSRFADEVKNHANGANVLHLLPARITDYSLPMPPQTLQREFSEKVSPLFDLIDNLQLKNEALEKARDLLLPRLMSGEIDV